MSLGAAGVALLLQERPALAFSAGFPGADPFRNPRSDSPPTRARVDAQTGNIVDKFHRFSVQVRSTIAETAFETAGYDVNKDAQKRASEAAKEQMKKDKEEGA